MACGYQGTQANEENTTQQKDQQGFKRASGAGNRRLRIEFLRNKKAVTYPAVAGWSAKLKISSLGCNGKSGINKVLRNKFRFWAINEMLCLSGS
jgi:hypothetical protein